jgi:hypothetical protein
MTAKSALLVIAFTSTVYASAAFLCGFEGDFRFSATIAVVALAGIFYLDHRAHERERTAHVRDDWLHDYELADSGFDEALREID